MTSQPDLWRRLRDDGIDRATRAAPDAWHDEARSALMHVCRTRESFTSTDVYEAMPPGIRDTAKGQALAGVLRSARTNGFCLPTMEFRNEKRARNHGRPQRVWKSLVFDGGSA